MSRTDYFTVAPRRGKQKWRIKLDLEHDRVIINKRMSRHILA